MSGIIKTGTSIQTLALNLGKPYIWQHNRGVNPLRVSIIDASNGQPVDPADLTVAFPDVNSITLTSAGGVASANIFVDWNVTTTNANSLAGLPGAVSPSMGFVG